MMDGGQLGVTATRQQRHRALANPPAAYLRAHRDHFAGALQPQDRRGSRRWVVASHPLADIGPVESRRGDLDQELLRPRLGRGLLADTQDRIIAGSLYINRLGGFSKKRLTSNKKRPATTPSIMRWSHDSVIIMVVPTTT